MESSVYINELIKCVRCGSCKAFCPTYSNDTTEAMSARGRLALLCALNAGQLIPTPELNDRIFSCTLCGMCKNQCPLGVEIKDLIYYGRNILKKTDKSRKYIRLLANFFVKKPRLSFKILNFSRHLVMPYLMKRELIPSELELPQNSLNDRFHVLPLSKKKGRVAIFAGCMVNFIYPYLGEALISVLYRLGYEIVFPRGQVCCGSPLRALGMEEESIKLAKKNIRLFKKLNVEAVLSLCPTCTFTLQVEYPKLIGEGIVNAKDISSFLIDRIDRLELPALSSRFVKAAYHDPCHLKYGLGITAEPRKILKDIGIDVIKSENEKCCGFAGPFSFSFKSLSMKLLQQCVNDYSKAGADMIITSCPGCMIQLSKEFKDKPVIHLIEAVEEAALLQETPSR